MIRSLTLAVALVWALAAVPVRAQVNTTTPRAGVNDGLFAQTAAISGMSELNLSELGVQKATDAELKKFSQRMIDDHTRMNNELKALAARKRITLPLAVDTRSQFCVESLAGLSGEEFDRCYAKAQMVAHMEACAAFEAEAERGQDPDLKALAKKGLPVIKEHYKMFKPIAKKYMKEEEEREESSEKASK